MEEDTAYSERPCRLAGFFGRLRAFFSRHGDESCGETSHVALSDNCGDCGSGSQHRVVHVFHRPGAEVPCCDPPQKLIVQAPRILPPPVEVVAVVQPTAPIQQVSAPPAHKAMEIAKEYVERVANAADYSWITGQLFYVHIHADQGLWVVRYAPVDKEDRYGGSVVLASAISMAGFREGDLVTVHGEILNQGRASRYLGGPLYRGLSVELKDRIRP
jgi:hypothetical protein